MFLLAYLEKAYGQVPTEIIFWVLDGMNEDCQITTRESCDSRFTVGLHQGSAFKSLSFCQSDG